MTIEFHFPHEKVKEWIIDYVKTKLIGLYHDDKAIARAEVYFKENPGATDGAKICEIELTVYGDSLFIRRNADSFEQASREAVEALAIEVEKQVKEQSEPPDTITSTVKV